MVFFNCSKKPPCSCFQPCSTTSCNANLPLSDDMGCLLSARQGRVVGRHPLSFYPHFQQEILQTERNPGSASQVRMIDCAHDSAGVTIVRFVVGMWGSDS